MSSLVKETDDELFLFRYLHDDPDSFSEWELNKTGGMKYNQAVHEAEQYAAFELKMEYRINKQTGEVTIDKVE